MTSRKPDAASLSGAYALHALGKGEAQEFEAQARDSEEARTEATELADTAVLLGLAVDPVAPPPSLKASIMAQLATTPQLPRDAAPAASAAPDARPQARAQARAGARWFARPVNAVVAVAAAVAIIVGGGVAVNTITTGLGQQAAADQLAAIYAADDSLTLKGPIIGGGEATLVYAASLRASALMVDGMKPLPAGSVYELWYLDDDGARAAGTFTVGPEGTTWRVLEGAMDRGDTVAVTVEPGGGSTAPSTDPVLVIASA